LVASGSLHRHSEAAGLCLSTLFWSRHRRRVVAVFACHPPAADLELLPVGGFFLLDASPETNQEKDAHGLQSVGVGLVIVELMWARSAAGGVATACSGTSRGSGAA